MVRWQPGARERLQGAALELFAEQGFDRTAVVEIAARAGVTERTFFRHFTDKREVLFTGQDEFEAMFTDAVVAATPGAGPLEVVAETLHAVATGFFPEERRVYAGRRQTVIDADAGLRERELLKLAGLSGTMAAALRNRGVPDATAALAAESGVTVFRVAFTRWVDGTDDRPLTAIQDDVLAELRALTAGPA